MPVRRRTNKKIAGIEAWRCFLETGFDFFADLEAAGIQEPIPVDISRDAWLRYRGQLRSEWAVTRHPSLGPSWAERTFEHAGA